MPALAIVIVLLIAPGAHGQARPGYQNVPGAQGEAGFRDDAPAGVAGVRDERTEGQSSQGSGQVASRGDGALDPGRQGALDPRRSGALAGFGDPPGDRGLPVTGVNLLALAAFGCILLACGLLLMRAARER